MHSFSIPRLNRAFLARRYCVLGSLGLLWLASSCSDKDSITVIAAEPSGEQTASAGSGRDGGAGNAGSGSAGEGGAAGTASAAGARNASEDPVYVVFSTIYDPDVSDDDISYYVTTSSIEGDSSVDVKTGIEQAGFAMIYAPPEGGYFLSGGGEAPTLTRWELDTNGRLVKGATLSMANFGVERTRSQMIFVNSTKAYFLDGDQLQLISINPETMEVLGTVLLEVDDFRCANPEEWGGFGVPIRREDGFWFAKSCGDREETISGSSLVHLNPNTDEITITHDPRCTGMYLGFMAGSGDAYWFSNPANSSVRAQLQLDIPHECALRLRAGETTFDPNWYLDLTSRSSNVPVRAVLPAGGAEIWVKTFVASAATEPLPVEQINWGLEAWRWGVLDVENDTMIEPDNDAELVVEFGSPILVDGRSFVPTSNDTYTETTLMEATSEGLRERLYVQGELRMIVKLR